MQVKVDDKVTFVIPNGLVWPGRVAAEPTVHPFIMRDGTEIEVIRASVVSLRETKEGEKFLAYTNETVSFGYREQMRPRHNHIVGLDVTEDGELIELQTVLDAQTKTYSKFLADLFESRQTVVDANDI